MDSKRTFRPLLLAGAVALASMVTVQSALAERAHGGPDPEQRLEHMTERLGLEDDQVALVREVLEDSRERGRAIVREQAGERRTAMKALREETDARLAGILTPAQMQMLEEERAARAEQRDARRGARREAGFERLVERLELAAGQIEPVREILEAGRARGRDIMQGARAEDLPREAVRERMDGVRAETEAELEAVLTPEQMEAFLAFSDERRDRGRRPRRGGGPRSR